MCFSRIPGRNLPVVDTSPLLFRNRRSRSKRSLSFGTALFLAAALSTPPATVHARPSTPTAPPEEVAREKTYTEIVSTLTRLANKNPEATRLFEIGKTPAGRKIYGLRIDPKVTTKTENARTILITGGIHGDEYLGFEHRLAEWFVEDKEKNPELRAFFASGGKILIIPVQNPDGFVKGTRANLRGKDLNRNFGEKSEKFEPEVNAVTTWVDREVAAEKRELSLSIDYHCCTGALLYPTAPRGRNLASVRSAVADESGPVTVRKPEDVDSERTLGGAFAHLSRVFSGLLKKTLGARFQLGKSSEILGYHAVGTAKDYYSENYRALSLTFEGYPARETNEPATTLPAQIALWTGILSQLNAGEL